MPCTTSLDVAAVATLYSQLSGVLAGFALTATFIVVAHFLGDAPPAGRREEALKEVVPVLLASLLGLIFTSLAYCVIAADSSNSGRALVEHVVAGVGFSVAGALLIFAAVLLMENVMPREAVPYGRRFLGQFTPLPIFALLCDGAYAYAKAYYGGQIPAWLNVLMAGLLVLLLGVSVIGYVAYDRTGLDGVRFADGGSTRGVAGCGLSIVTTCTLLVTLGVAIGGGGCSVPIAVVVTITVGGFLAAVGLSVWLFLSRPARPAVTVPAPPGAPASPDTSVTRAASTE